MKKKDISVLRMFLIKSGAVLIFLVVWGMVILGIIEINRTIGQYKTVKLSDGRVFCCRIIDMGVSGMNLDCGRVFINRATNFETGEECERNDYSH